MRRPRRDSTFNQPVFPSATAGLNSYSSGTGINSELQELTERGSPAPKPGNVKLQPPRRIQNVSQGLDLEIPPSYSGSNFLSVPSTAAPSLQRRNTISAPTAASTTNGRRIPDIDYRMELDRQVREKQIRQQQEKQRYEPSFYEQNARRGNLGPQNERVFLDNDKPAQFWFEQKSRRRAHVSMRADELPDPKQVRAELERDLQEQIMRKKQLELDQKKKEKEEEEKEIARMRQQQEKMTKAFEEEQMKKQMKERKRLERADALARRQEVLLNQDKMKQQGGGDVVTIPPMPDFSTAISTTRPTPSPLDQVDGGGTGGASAMMFPPSTAFGGIKNFSQVPGMGGGLSDARMNLATMPSSDMAFLDSNTVQLGAQLDPALLNDYHGPIDPAFADFTNNDPLWNTGLNTGLLEHRMDMGDPQFQLPSIQVSPMY
ncbi:unnamed protein product [Darwinula stevensoni]|uniref:Uncharacterized protein n=1 Tax=Darwinula stevensoni TaxID=69355 RepID=A0A7R8X0Y1_9CRUS|nr:unnamed protein product [Darwinula stevensoni]CAG0882211.1 unnamed protein product [Darwinula stevensoni]